MIILEKIMEKKTVLSSVAVVLLNEPDASAFFADVKTSQAQHGLVAFGKGCGKELR